MRHASLLDCTLRDGAYLVNKKFGETTIKGIVDGLINTQIDFIEIGFFQDDEYGEGKTVFRNSKEAKKYIPKDKRGCKFTVLADYSRYSISNLDAYREDSVDAVRECFFKKERYEAVKVCKEIMAKGYKLFVQPVDILGYTDVEIIELIEMINEIEPFCFSIVDTFGSMYIEDLQRIFYLIDHNLVSTCKIGFHSHNNMQMSAALSQEFLKLSYGKREVIVDGTISGMGRGAGNTPIELLVQYMVSKMGYNYDIDALLDTIDGYMDNIRSRCTWGYSTDYFVAGSYGAHVNNISYLESKSSIRSKDIRYILNKIGSEARKKYDYDLIEKTYIDYIKADIDDEESINELKNVIGSRKVLIIAPGRTIKSQYDKVREYIEKNTPIIITVNFIDKKFDADFLYLSNTKRYDYWKNSVEFSETKKIIVSNVMQKKQDENTMIVSFGKLIKCGWEHMDNSTILLLRLLDQLGVCEIAIAGFDGYGYVRGSEGNYASNELELYNVQENPNEINKEIASMLEDYIKTRKNNSLIKFVTDSRFKGLMEGE